MNNTIFKSLNRRFLSVISLLVVLVIAGAATAASNVEMDLTQSPEVSGTAEGKVKMPKQQQRMALNYVNQPPLIPHSVDGYQVSKNTNRCLQCHGVEHYRTTGAPRVSPTHFIDRWQSIERSLTTSLFLSAMSCATNRCRTDCR